jgi:putative transport protein
MQPILDLLASNQLLLLFVVIGLGYLAGNLKIFSFQLGVVAVLFVGILLGAVDRRLALPEHVYVIGLVLFVYAIGLQSGPGFFASFRKRGLRVNLAVIAILAVGGALVVLLAKLLGLSGPTAAGLFCGALTNTPALAATVETVKGLASGASSEAAAALASSPVVAYGLVYPFGVLGVILGFFVFRKIFRVDLANEKTIPTGDQRGPILSATFKVANPGIFGTRLEDVLSTVSNRAFSVSRIQQGDDVTVVRPDLVLQEGNLIVAVGDERELERARVLFGERCQEHLEENLAQIRFRRIFVSSKEVAGNAVRDLHLEARFGATITRLRRGDVELVPAPDTVIELGDRIRVVCPKEKLDEVSAYLGDSLKGIVETDFLSLSLGIVIGVLVGLIPIPLPGGVTFKLGFAGGPLIVALVLGRLERTGPISWGLPFSANLLLRQVGLVFFLAGIGSRAGLGFLETMRAGGLRLVVAGAVVTAVVTAATMVVGYRLLGLPLAAVMGVASGLQTQPACLAYANQQANNELPNVWYAAVYPAAMVAKIILAQVIVTVLFTSG